MREENVFADVIVKSPPYNINKEYATYKDNKEEHNYLDWLQNVAEVSLSILKQDGSFFLNIGNRVPHLPILIVERFKASGYTLQNTIHWIKSVSIDPEDIGRNNGLRNSNNNDNISIGHFSPIVSDRYLTNLHEYIFHFTKTGDIKIDKLAVGVTYQDKTNIGRWKSATKDRRDRGNLWYISERTLKNAVDF